MKSRGGLRLDGTLDIECASWTRFAIAATYRPQHGVRFHTSLSDLVDSLLHNGGTMWASNGGRYDAIMIADELTRRGLRYSVDYSRGRMTRLVCGHLTIRDSWSLVPLAMDDAVSIAGIPCPVLDLPCVCGERCGGYCSIRPNDRRPQLRRYVAADVAALWSVLVAVFRLADDLDLVLKGTIGTTAWETLKRDYRLPDANTILTPGLYRELREGYYGGRQAIIRPHAAGPGSHWDISSAWPAALIQAELPVGTFDLLGGDSATRAFDAARPGIYTCSVSVPWMFLPPLPVRVGSRISYPHGEFRGTWTYPELAAALSRGVTLRKVHTAIAWSATERLFSAAITRWHDARLRAGKDSGVGQWLRLLPNSFTGKLAETPERKTIYAYPPLDKVRLCNLRRPCSVERCTFQCGAWEPLDEWARFWAAPFYRLGDSAHVHWAAYTTALTREAWLRGAESQDEDLIYGNTDSVWTTRDLASRGPYPQGSALGQWEYKHAWSEWECRGPSAYRYRDPAGDRVVRSSGMSLTDDEWERGEASRERGVLGFVEAVRTSGAQRGLFRRAYRHWDLLPTDTAIRYGDRLLDRDRQITYPYHYDEIPRRHIGRRAARS